MGWAVATGSDFDGDGVADIAAGAPCATVAGMVEAGRVFVYSGADGKKLATLSGTAPGQKLGGALSFMPDVSGDGLADLIVGSPGYPAPRPGGRDARSGGSRRGHRRLG